MDVLVDASVIVAVIANEPEKDTLIELTKGARLVAPHSIHWEIGNAFSAMLKRKRITLEQARKAIAAYKKIPIKLVDIVQFIHEGRRMFLTDTYSRGA